MKLILDEGHLCCFFLDDDLAAKSLQKWSFELFLIKRWFPALSSSNLVKFSDWNLMKFPRRPENT